MYAGQGRPPKTWKLPRIGKAGRVQRALQAPLQMLLSRCAAADTNSCWQHIWLMGPGMMFHRDALSLAIPRVFRLGPEGLQGAGKGTMPG